MVEPSFRDGEHLLRVAALFLAGLVAFAVLRVALVPKGFGVYGHYRAGALEDNRDRSLVYAGHAACEECHRDVADLRRGGPHGAIGCESCHGPQGAHATSGDPKPERPNGRDLCLGCHARNVSRPARFPQVEAAEHASPGPCTACHAAHRPRPPSEKAP